MSKYARGSLAAIAVLIGSGVVWGGANPDRKYVPDRIIVKFTENAADVVHGNLSQKIEVNDLKVSRSLDRLNKKHRLKSIQPLFKGFRDNRNKFKELLKKDISELTSRNKRLVMRQKRAPKNITVPALDRIYKLTVELDADTFLEDIVAEYNLDPDIEYAELDYIVSAFQTPNDPNYSDLWGIDKIGAPKVWDVSIGNSEIVVAVVDSGVDYGHRDLDDNIWFNPGEIPDNGYDDDDNGYVDDIYGYDFINNDSDPIDDNGHGTFCSGIIAAEGNNGLDVTGVCWNVKIMGLKFLGKGGSGYTSDAVNAFYYAVNNGADVVSNSWGGGAYAQSMQEAIDYAHSQGVIMVASAGNSNSTDIQYPAGYDNVLSVAATDPDDERASFSNHGNWVDIAAPGVGILSLRASGTSMGTVHNAYTTIASGTSMACPYVAGSCALLLSVAPTLTPNDLMDLLIDNSDPVSAGWGPGIRLNLAEAVRAAIPQGGMVSLDSKYYSCSSKVGISLADLDLAGAGINYVTVSTSGGDSETVALTETFGGLFTGSIYSESGPITIENGSLEVSDGETFTVTYHNFDAGSGDPTDTATVDCQEPGISNVMFASTSAGPEPTVTFDTDEGASGRVYYGTSCGAATVSSSVSFGTSHSVRLTDLTANTNYYFKIETVDLAGNTTVDDNSGLCYSLNTGGPIDLYVPSEYSTIQSAIDTPMWDGSTIWVAEGIYMETVDFKGKSVTVSSTDPDDWNVVAATIIDAGNLGNAVIFCTSEDANSVLSGFTVTGANGIYPYNRGIYCYRGDESPTISKCIIRGNNIGISGALVTIEKCIVEGNVTGISIKSGTVENCEIYNNSSLGIICRSSATASIENNLIYENYNGIGVYRAGAPSIVNNTITDNTIWGIKSLSRGTQTPTITNCIVWGNGYEQIHRDFMVTNYITYNCIENWASGGTGNIDVDPLFVDSVGVDGIIGTEDDDLRLQSGSLCIDAGGPNFIAYPNATDLDGNPRIADANGNGEKIVDMGAYEFVEALEVSMKFTPQAVNLFARGKWVMGHFVLPEGFSVADVDVGAGARLEPFGVDSHDVDVFVNDEGMVEVEAVFDRSQLWGYAANGPTVEVAVSGKFVSGQCFYGRDTIKIMLMLEYFEKLSLHWLEMDCGAPDWCDGADADHSSVVDMGDLILNE